jgi:hypothetical protein
METLAQVGMIVLLFSGSAALLALAAAVLHEIRRGR